MVGDTVHLFGASKNIWSYLYTSNIFRSIVSIFRCYLHAMIFLINLTILLLCIHLAKKASMLVILQTFSDLTLIFFRFLPNGSHEM